MKFLSTVRKHMAMAEDQLSLNIDKMLDSLATESSNHSISRVCDRLRSINEKAFDPKIIAIGPLHRDKPQLQSMELHKMRYLKSFLEKSSIKTDGYVTAIRGLEREARKCYAETIKLGSDEFVLMLLLDGVFILQFLRKYYSKQVENQDDADNSDVVFHFQHTVVHLLHDLMLFENQIPLFVIKHLFEKSKIHDEEQFVDLIWPLVEMAEIRRYESRVSSSLQGCNAPHLLGLVHHAKCLPLSDLKPCPNFTVSEMNDMNSATEMQEAGIIFKKANPQVNSTKGDSFLNIKFDNRTMKIQPLLISNDTESWFRNMIAYENGFPWGSQKCIITDYIFFMHRLIQSPRDVKLLRRCGIISSWTGGDESVYHLIKQLENEIDVSEKFTYADVVLRATNHCKHKRNKWMAILRQNYFDSPWKFISFVAAVILLLLTALQTLFAILSYPALNER